MNTKMKELLEEFPNMYKGVKLPRSKSLVPRDYFPINSGWFEVLTKYSSEIESIITNLSKQEQSSTYAMDITKRNGMLRIYMSSINEDIEKQINLLGTESRTICEYCGNPGQLFNNEAVFCETHRKTYDKQKYRKFRTISSH